MHQTELASQRIRDDLPTIDDTIDAISVAGRIIDELRARLGKAERDVARLETETRTLKSELVTIVRITADRARTQPTAQPNRIDPPAQPDRIAPPPAAARSAASLDEAMAALIRNIDASFARPVARH